MSEAKGVTQVNGVMEHKYFAGGEWRSAVGNRVSGWGRTGPDSLKEFQDVIWINSHSGQRQYPF